MKTLKPEEMGKNINNAFRNYEAQQEHLLKVISESLSKQRNYTDEFEKELIVEVKHLIRINDKKALLNDLLTNTIT